MGKSRLFYEFTHSHRTAGLARSWRAASVSYGKATTYLPVIDLLKSYFKIGDRDDHARDPREGHGQAADAGPRARAAAARLLALLDVPVEDAALASARSAAAPPAHARRRQAPAAAREPGAAAARRVRGPALDRLARPRRCSTAWSRACPRARCCCSSTTGPSTSTAGAARPTTRSFGIDPLAAESAEELLRALLGDGPRPCSRCSALLIERTEGNPFFLEESVRTLVETECWSASRGAYRLTHP